MEGAAKEGAVAAAGQGQGESGDSLPRGLNEPHRAQPSVLYCIKGEPGQRVRRWQMNEPINSNKDDSSSSSRGRQQAEAGSRQRQPAAEAEAAPAEAALN